MKASERQSDLPKVTWLFDAGMRRGGKERLKKKKKERKLGEGECGGLWVSESRSKNETEILKKEYLSKSNSELWSFSSCLSVPQVSDFWGVFFPHCDWVVSGAQSKLWLEISKILGSINRGMMLRVREVKIYFVLEPRV